MTPSQSSIFQEVSPGNRSVLSSSSNLNSPKPQEQSGVIVGNEEEDGLKEGGEEVVGGEDDVGRNEMDGTADGTPRFGSHGMSIFHGS